MSMFRYRRYRVYVVFAFVALAALYHFSSVRDWQDGSAATTAVVEGLRNPGGAKAVDDGVIKTSPKLAGSAESSLQSTTATPTAKSPNYAADPNETYPPQTTSTEVSTTSLSTASLSLPTDIPEVENGRFGEFGLGGKGRYEPAAALPDKPAIHWTRTPEHFPIPPDSLIPLPTDKAKSIPKIQYKFKDESPSAKADREKKLSLVKSAFKHSWTGYRTHAWMQDELSPVSGGSRNPFCSWAATLVDALDTLWIMGMEEEFAEAVQAVGQIDFTTSPRKDIPVFETTIRYLGGLVAAYDLSGARYRVLLDKAVELADILMGAFDTPNRMPISYYYWRPTFSSNPHRAATRVVLAELGSLSMEFTRLAQLTKNPRYYDAIARITNELEVWQNNTKLPGLWPKSVDASGCKKPEYSAFDQVPLAAKKTPVTEQALEANAAEMPAVAGEKVDGGASTGASTSAALPLPEQVAGNEASSSGSDTKAVENKATSGGDLPVGGASVKPSAQEELAPDLYTIPGGTAAHPPTNEKVPTIAEKQTFSNKVKRQLDTGSLSENLPTSDIPETAAHLIDTNPLPEKVDCEPQGLASPPDAHWEGFTMGGMADSTYEYLPKMYMLLGGNVPNYKSMYEKAADAANEYLIYRPMVPENRDLLVVGSADVTDNAGVENKIKGKADHSHLNCFTGGMFGIGAKIFGRDEDLEIAKKLTDACVWAYEATGTGIMPENMVLIPCEDRNNCAWNETKWYDMLDPWRHSREASQKELEGLAQKAANYEAAKETMTVTSTTTTTSTVAAAAETTSAAAAVGIDAEKGDDKQSSPIAKRQLDLNEANTPENPPAAADAQAAPPTQTKPEIPTYTPPVFPTHEEYVQERIKKERIPIGIPSITSKTYILRPEAIESVFIMYRITGDEIWREKGWKMFEAIDKHTRAEYGHSAIGDVTDPESYKLDEMESFWLAETLKYFYLLFSPPTTISLDDYVLNTEAHPFKRPSNK